MSVLESGFMLGDGVWEGMRLHRGVLLFARQHMERLFEGAKAIDMDIGELPESCCAPAPPPPPHPPPPPTPSPNPNPHPTPVPVLHPTTPDSLSLQRSEQLLPCSSRSLT